jgi:hypothetical protein
MTTTTMMILILLMWSTKLLLFLHAMDAAADSVFTSTKVQLSSAGCPNFSSSSSSGKENENLQRKRIPQNMMSGRVIILQVRGGGNDDDDDDDACLTTNTTTATESATLPSSEVTSSFKRLVMGVIVVGDTDDSGRVATTTISMNDNNPPSSNSSSTDGHQYERAANDNDGKEGVDGSPLLLLFPWLKVPNTTAFSMTATSSTSTSTSTVLFLDGKIPRVYSPSAILRISKNEHNNRKKKDDGRDKNTDYDDDDEQLEDDDYTVEESLALLCDIVLLVILPSSASSSSSALASLSNSSPPRQRHTSVLLDSIVAALVKGMDQRCSQNNSTTATIQPEPQQAEKNDDNGRTPFQLSPGILLVASPLADNATWVQHMVQTIFADISTPQWQAMEFRTFHDLYSNNDGVLTGLARTFLFPATTGYDDQFTSSSTVLSSLFPDATTTTTTTGPTTTRTKDDDDNDNNDSDSTNEEKLFVRLLQAVIQSKQQQKEMKIKRHHLSSSPTVISLEYPPEDDEEEIWPPPQVGWMNIARKNRKEFDEETLSLSSTTTTYQTGSTSEETLSTTPSGEILQTTTSNNGPQQHPANIDSTIQEIITSAQRRVEELETKMESLVLQQSSSSPSSLQEGATSALLPLLEFGILAQDILYPMDDQLRKLMDDKMIPDTLYGALMSKVENEVVRLYKDQLQALRNYYGEQYEVMIASSMGDAGGGESSSPTGSDTERQRAEAAEYATKGFIVAAENAVPAMYRETNTKVQQQRVAGSHSSNDNNDCSGRRIVDFDHVDAYRGLIQDMMDATQRLEDEHGLAEMLLDDDDDDGGWNSAAPSTGKKRRRQMPKWLERIAARAFVFGVNYIQGWLAWQGIKRAAIERDRNQPKFPLF